MTIFRREVTLHRKKKGRKAINSNGIWIDNIYFPSTTEGRNYCDLKLLERAGEIFNLEIHKKYDLSINGVLIGTYSPDAVYHDKNANLTIEEVKPKPKTKKAEKYLRSTTNWRIFEIKRKLMKAIYDIDVVVKYL